MSIISSHMLYLCYKKNFEQFHPELAQACRAIESMENVETVEFGKFARIVSRQLIAIEKAGTAHQDILRFLKSLQKFYAAKYEVIREICIEHGGLCSDAMLKNYSLAKQKWGYLDALIDTKTFADDMKELKKAKVVVINEVPSKA